MNDYTLAEVFGIVYSREFAVFDNPLKHYFPRSHRKAMREILYPRTNSAADNRRIPLKKRVLIVLMVILLSAFGIAAGAAAIRGFTRKEYRDNTKLFALNDDNYPKTIEDVYYLPDIPDGFELCEQIFNTNLVHLRYDDSSTNRKLIFDQHVKEGFSTQFDNEQDILEEMEISGKYALYSENNSFGIIILDNEDYIFEISGNLTKNELISLAESVKYKTSIS